MTNTKGVLSVVFGLLIFGGCKSPDCKSTNDIFNKYSPDSKVYKDELIKKLSATDVSKLSYWLGAYWKKMDKSKTIQEEHIRVHIKGADICADMILTIGDSREGIEVGLENEMLGYYGAEFEDLHFDIHQDSTRTEFIFRAVSGIRD